MAEILVKNARLDGAVTDVLLSGRTVSRTAPSIPVSPDAAVIDAKGGVVIPGFVDCHSHIDKSHLMDGGRAKYVHGTGAVKGGLTRVEKAAFTVEDIYKRAEAVVKTAIASGTLFLRTNCDVDSYVGLKGIEALTALRENYKDDITIQIAAFAQEGVFQDDKTQGLLNDAMRMGADLVGGHTITFGEGERHIDFILELAAKYGVEADFHLDESGNRENYLLPYLARRMKETGLCGRVNAIHMCTLSALNDAELAEALDIISGCSLKATIAPTAISTRKIAPVKELLKLGIPVGLGSDNIRDFFNPMGSGDIKQIAYLLTYLQAFFTDEEIGDIWSMITDRGAKVISADYGVREGGRADLTIFPSADVREIIAYQLRPSHIIRSGRLIG